MSPHSFNLVLPVLHYSRTSSFLCFASLSNTDAVSNGRSLHRATRAWPRSPKIPTAHVCSGGFGQASTAFAWGTGHWMGCCPDNCVAICSFWTCTSQRLRRWCHAVLWLDVSPHLRNMMRLDSCVYVCFCASVFFQGQVIAFQHLVRRCKWRDDCSWGFVEPEHFLQGLYAGRVSRLPFCQLRDFQWFKRRVKQRSSHAEISRVLSIRCNILSCDHGRWDRDRGLISRVVLQCAFKQLIQ